MSSLRAQFTGDASSPPGEAAETALPPPSREFTPPPDMAERSKRGIGMVTFSIIMSAFWAGAASAYLWGYFAAQGVARPDLQILSFAVIVAFLPPFLFIAAGVALARAQAMGETARKLAEVSLRLTSADETAAAGAQRLGRAIRRELDALTAGLDSAFGRMRALDTALEDRMAQLEEAGARAGVRADTIATRLSAEREGIEELAARIDDSAQRAAETLAGRVAQLKAMIEAAGNQMKSAGQTLETQAAQFRDSAEKAAAAPVATAIELDRQAKQIETTADAAVARAEFVLARQERQRVAMSELLANLKEEGAILGAVLDKQRDTAERAASVLTSEAQRLDILAEQGLSRVDAAMASAASRSTELASGFARDADKVKQTVEGAAEAVAKLVDSLREAAASAQALIAESTADAKSKSKDFVGEAMGQCHDLLKAAAAVAEEAEKARASLARATEEAHRHIIAIPGVAAQEAGRVREALRAETEQMLDVSARTLATLQARRRTPKEDETNTANARDAENSMGESLRGLARRVTGPKRRADDRKGEDRPKGNFELSAVLAAADTRDAPKQNLKVGAASALAALQAAIADLAVDLDELAGETADPALWRRYLDGDRGVFARRLAASIGPDSIDRITALYRDNPRFHESADSYLEEFEALLGRARDGDRDGFLASTLLTADTGKIFLAIAYALGRLD